MHRQWLTGKDPALHGPDNILPTIRNPWRFNGEGVDTASA